MPSGMEMNRAGSDVVMRHCTSLAQRPQATLACPSMLRLESRAPTLPSQVWDIMLAFLAETVQSCAPPRPASGGSTLFQKADELVA